MDVTLNDAGELITKWHLKSTNTGLYIPAMSCCPNKYKKAAMNSLFDRSRKLCSRTEDIDSSHETIKNMFCNNGYHPKYIDNIRVRNSHLSSQLTKPRDDSDRTPLMWKLDYSKEGSPELLKGVSTLNNYLSRCKIYVIFQTFKTQNLFACKDRVPSFLYSSVVYRYDCEYCKKYYIGETRRHLFTRITEHLKGNPQSEISAHIHIPNRQSFTVLARARHTKITEAMLLRQADTRQCLNANTRSCELYLF